MPTTFIEAKEELLEFAKRPSDTTWGAVAGRAINEAIVKLQRIIPNLHAITKVKGGFTYTADSDQVSFTDIDEATDLNKIISVEKTTGNALVGIPIRCYTYNQLSLERASFYEDRIPNPTFQDYDTHERYVEKVFQYFAVVLGTDLMLYPKPSVDIALALHYTPWLKPLVNDTDTNVILKYCWDYVLYASLLKLNVLLSESDRIEVNAAALSYALREVRTWDSSMEYSNPIDS